ncbi:MAG: hypothetical protein H0W83_03645, partial [Planctomycetes bacterium]|nr:hypothetical protein [Planctomycetota bacterium]
MHHRRFLLVLAAVLFPLAAWAADAPPADAVHDSLAKITGLTEKDGRFTWEDGKGASIAVSDYADGQPIVESGGVRISVPQSLIASEHTEAIKAIPGLAKAAKILSGKGWTLDVSALAGPILRGDKAVAVADKVLKKIEIASTDRSKDRDKLKTATAQFSARLESLGMNDDARKATEAILLLMNQDDKDRSLDEATPEFARRIARNGWLSQILTDAKDQKVVNELKQAVLAAEKMAPVTSYVDGSSNLSEMRDAFGHGGWVLNLPNRVAYAVPHEEPQFLVGGWTRKRQHDLDLVVELPAKSDPFTDADKAVSARIYKKKRLLASWDGKVFTADDKAWHEA